jgi:serine/threonine protein kinase
LPYATESKADLLAPGVLLGERYLIEEKLGQGGVGVVYRARDRKLHNTPVVIKVLQERWRENQHREWFEKKFRAEIAALARIDHPGVVRALDVGSLPDGQTYLVMQFVSGLSLRSQITPQGMEFQRAANLLRQIGHALAAAHERNVIHRDLKPENIMLQQTGSAEFVKLIDFGIASVFDSAEKAGIKTTLIAGTPAYIAPEQLRGKPTPASDIYALGVIAFELVTGRRPFEADTAVQLLEQQRAGVPVPPRDLRPDLSTAAQATILKALAFEAHDRYASALDFTEALVLALTLAPSPPKPRPNWLALSVLLVALVLVVIAGSLFWQRSGGVTSRPTETAQPATASVAERQLSYWLTVQRDPRRYPGSQPFRLPGEMLFGAGDQVRLHISSPQSGYLYVINEGPRQTNGLPNFNVLFPEVKTNGGSAAIKANQPVQLPPPSRQSEQDWFIFDREEGVEKVWLI